MAAPAAFIFEVLQMTPTEFKANYPQFSTLTDAQVQVQLDLFVCLYGEDYGCVQDYLQGLFVAHQLAVSTTNGNGPVQAMTNRSVGDVSVGYAQSRGAANAGDFASTKYGLEFDRLVRMYGAGPMLSGVNRG